MRGQGCAGQGGATLSPAALLSLFQSYLFLLSSDYERSEWREAIQKLQKKGKSWPVEAPMGHLFSSMLG